VARNATGAAVSEHPSRRNCRNAVATIPALALYTWTDIIVPEKRKLLYWEGSSKKDFKEFPVHAQKDMGVALFVVQLGGTPDAAKPWKGLGSGVYELVEYHRGDTFRAVYTVKVRDAVHVLHAFQKKSKTGIATPQPDVELIEKRLKTVLARYAASRRT
jgi:phage-related protein